MYIFNTIARYIKIYLSLLKASLIAELEYRSNITIKLIADLLWYVGRISIFEVIYLHTSDISGWKISNMRVFLGIVFMVDALSEALFSENFEMFANKVSRGDLDLILTKPINSQFMVSLQKANTSQFFSLLLGVFWFLFSFGSLPESQQSYSKILWLFLLIPNGVCILYFYRFFLAATSILFVRAENLQFMWYSFYRISLRPDFMFTPWFRLIITTIFPLAMISSIPARILMDSVEPWLICLTLAMGPFLIWISNKYWRYCLRHYSSASS